jgi:hypothetical protein
MYNAPSIVITAPEKPPPIPREPLPSLKPYLVAIVVLLFVLGFCFHFWGVYKDEVQKHYRLADESRIKFANFCFDNPNDPVNTATRLNSDYCRDLKAIISKDFSKEIYHAVLKEHLDHIPLWQWFQESETGKRVFDNLVDTFRMITGPAAVLVWPSILLLLWLTYRVITMTSVPPPIYINKQP